MKPESFAKDSESSQQLAFFCWAGNETKNNPILKRLYHIPNGDSRGDTADSRAIAGGRLKGQGVKAGVPDIHLPVARHGFNSLYIEMKRPDLKRADDKMHGCSDSQKDWIEFLRSENNLVFIAYTWQEARDCVEYYLK